MSKMALPGIMKSRSLIGPFVLILSLCSCSSPDHSGQLNQKEVIVTKTPAPNFNADSAYQYIKDQVNFGPRIPNTAAHDSCAIYLIKKLNSYNLEVKTQKGELEAYNGTKLNFTNIITSVNPEAKNKIMLCAHWDTRPYADQEPLIKTNSFDGASDGGSGVGVLLEMARLMSKNKPRIGVDLIFFDIEDYGHANVPDSYCLGSQYWAKSPMQKNYYPKYGVLIDMVGAKNATFGMEGYSMQFAPHVVNKVWKIAAKAGFSDHFIFKRTNATIDDHYYVNTIANVPCIDIIQYDPTTKSGFGSYWHTTKDNMDIIDKSTLKAVGQTLLELVYAE